jgi:hypothetical protein
MTQKASETTHDSRYNGKSRDYGHHGIRSECIPVLAKLPPNQNVPRHPKGAFRAVTKLTASGCGVDLALFLPSGT